MSRGARGSGRRAVAIVDPAPFGARGRVTQLQTRGSAAR